jgi:hypothetical protein
MKTLLAVFFCVVAALSAAPLVAQQAPPVASKTLVEKKLTELPPEPLFWRIETFSVLAEAQTAAGPTGLAAEVSGKVWLFTLGPQAGAAPAGTKVAEIGPLAPTQAREYLLRVMHVSGPPGARSSQHSHPGSEAFFVLKGRLGQRTSHGIVHADAGTAMNGHGVDMPMEVFNAGTTDLEHLAMFVVDATRPFTSPARLE